MNNMPNYNDRVKPIYSVILMNIITLGGCAAISLFAFDDIILFFLYWVQIIAANNNQGFLNQKYCYIWRIIDVVGACVIFLYTYYNYVNIFPEIVIYPYFVIMTVSAYSQSVSKSMIDYIYLVNIWHMLVLYSSLLLLYFGTTNMIKNILI